MSVRYIDEHRYKLGVEPICKVPQMAPSTYYAATRRIIDPSARTVREAVSLLILLTLWAANRRVDGAASWSLLRSRIPRRFAPRIW